MSSHTHRLPVGRPPSTRAHKRRKPVPKYDTIDWDNPSRPVALGVDTDYSCSRAFRCTTLQVERRRREYFIPAPPHREEQGVWPSDEELRRQNEEAGERREAEVREQVLIRSSGGWMVGRMDREDDEDC